MTKKLDGIAIDNATRNAETHKLTIWEFRDPLGYLLATEERTHMDRASIKARAGRLIGLPFSVVNGATIYTIEVFSKVEGRGPVMVHHKKCEEF